MEIKFEHIEYLYLLFSIPVILTLMITYIRWQKRASAIFADDLLMKELSKSKSSRRKNIKYSITILVLFFIILGLSNPKLGSDLEEIKREGIEIVIALDLSNSMLCEDIKPSRLTRSKQAISDLIDKLDGDKIGLVIFAGDAFIQLPITSDYSIAKMFLSTINTQTIETQGTDFSLAIEKSVDCFNFQNELNKSIIIITDGEDHEHGAIESAQKAAEKGVFIHTLSVGLEKGGLIPELNDKGKKTGKHKTDSKGITVVTKPNYSFLEELANNGNGENINANNSRLGLEKLFKEIKKIEKKEVSSVVFTNYTSRFQWFLTIAFSLIILDLIILGKKNKILTINKFRVK